MGEKTSYCPKCGHQIPSGLLKFNAIEISQGGKNLTCPYCSDVLWLDKAGFLKSASEKHREIEKSDASSIEKERCVILSCDKETQYTKDTPIKERMYYVRGAGQLCQSCHEKFYPEGGD